eukprot:gnl/MRDRNA2_/MRDRNA2_81156_c0_seq1.p1 gnl/MRDRNA2_/MRDRNA2_81156_c0~~gnl/MRDRNA2_/MRDRNA2_81156_c0_seq1.p1  ORF type:complete len:380 (+),score=64.81 gnl/MRDRNA2_/MRDRNA2_81156_c0_seq1:105-1244(+)
MTHGHCGVTVHHTPAVHHHHVHHNHANHHHHGHHHQTHRHHGHHHQTHHRQTHHHKLSPSVLPIVPVSTFARRRSHARSPIKQVRVVNEANAEVTALQETTQVLQSLMSVLGVQSVQMDGVTENPDATFFDVQTILCNGRSIKVSRRYNNFLALYRSLICIPDFLHIADADFPRKHFFRCKGEKLAVRQQKLMFWLHDELQSPANPSSQKLLAGFLGLEKDSECSNAEFNRIALSPPSAPAQDLAGEEGMELQIHVPEGVRAGQRLEFCVPSGTKLTVAVPEGVAGGSIWRLWYDNATGTLTSLPNNVDRTAAKTESGILLEITIPQGLRSDERVTVTVPDGRSFTINPPKGAVAGAVLRLWFEPVLGSLTLLGTTGSV